eukprot:2268995-Karenia_brevis.AAC.1
MLLYRNETWWQMQKQLTIKSRAKHRHSGAQIQHWLKTLCNYAAGRDLDLATVARDSPKWSEMEDAFILYS